MQREVLVRRARNGSSPSHGEQTVKITRIAEPANETGFDVLAQTDRPEIVIERGTVAVYMDNGYRIVLSPADVLGIASMAVHAMLPPEQRPVETDAGMRMRMLWPLNLRLTASMS